MKKVLRWIAIPFVYIIAYNIGKIFTYRGFSFGNTVLIYVHFNASMVGAFCAIMCAPSKRQYVSVFFITFALLLLIINIYLFQKHHYPWLEVVCTYVESIGMIFASIVVIIEEKRISKQ